MRGRQRRTAAAAASAGNHCSLSNGSPLGSAMRSRTSVTTRAQGPKQAQRAANKAKQVRTAALQVKRLPSVADKMVGLCV